MNPRGRPHLKVLQRANNADVMFDINRNKLFNVHSSCWWFEIWCSGGVTVMSYMSPMAELYRVYLGRKLTRWFRVMHMCVKNWVIIDADNGLSPLQRQVITSPAWRQTIIYNNNGGISLNWSIRTKFSKIWNKLQWHSHMRINLKLSFA